MIRVHGFDLAPNHGACCELTDGELTGFWFVTQNAGATELGGEHAIRMKLPRALKQTDRLLLGMLRLSFWERFLWHLIKRRAPDYVGIEDYALEGGSHGAHYKGEVGGVARIIFWMHKIPMRLHDPSSVKMFAAHDGHAGKTAMVEAVAQRWRDFREFNPPLSLKAKKTAQPHTETGEDLADSLAVAHLVWTEIQIRSGALHTSDLQHPKERQVFNRTSRAFPANVLDRPWLVPGADES